MLAIVCSICGKSPVVVGALEGKVQLRSQDITDWPDELRITNFYTSVEEGPSVEIAR